MEFSERTNIITGGGMSGKSTILRSIFTDDFENLLSVHANSKGCIRIELYDTTSRMLLDRISTSIRYSSFFDDRGEQYINAIRAAIRRTSHGSGLLIEDDMTSRLDRNYFSLVASILRDAECQVIMVIRSRRDLNELIEIYAYANIFEAVRDPQKMASELLLRHEGTGRIDG